jgi:uncharacterized membrane protein
MLSRLQRLFKHRWMEDASRVLPPDALQRLQAHVAASEQQHSGEIRICVEAGLPNSYLLRPDTTAALLRQRALAQFGRLRVWDTEHNNGVLIYLLLAERRIEIVADRGLQRCASAQDWQAVVAGLATQLKADQFEAGLTQALEEVSALLVEHFPLTEGLSPVDELPNTVVRV